MPIQYITTAELKSFLANSNNSANLVDVRPAREHRHEHIQGKHLSFDDYLKNLANLSTLEALNNINILYCTTGIRSAEEAQKLSKKYPEQLFYILQGGLSAAKAENLAIEKSNRFYLPIPQQVQIAIGLMLILINILAYLNGYGSAWFMLSLIMGVGLCLAGLTGFCGLAIVISKMPWNR